MPFTKKAYSPLLGGLAPGITLAETAITSLRLNVFVEPAVYVRMIVSVLGTLAIQVPCNPVLVFDVTTTGPTFDNVTNVQHFHGAMMICLRAAAGDRTRIDSETRRRYG